MSIGFYTPPFYALNNFSSHAIEIDGKLYPTAEHAYQAAKCTDNSGKEAIRKALSPLQAKILANETFRDARDTDWDNKKVNVMEQILRTKLAQHDEVRNTLERSGDEDIVEDSPVDYFWGEGKDGSGKNQLGKLWMKIRSELS
jgi:N-glycosidase YbiA